MLSELMRPGQHVRFHSQDESRALIARALGKSEAAEFSVIGRSEGGRAIYAVTLGRGARRVLLMAGAHADEPVGPEALRAMIVIGLAKPEAMGDLLERYTFVIVPHVNPDAEAMNTAWIQRWPDPQAYLREVAREMPGRDVEFGYPAMRAENRCVSKFVAEHGPYELYVNLHGMGFAEGAMLLIERHWVERTQAIRRSFAADVAKCGLGLHDHDRRGEKGFAYIAPGFTTTPEGAAMRAHFEAAGDMETASKFHSSSMEYVRTLGGDPLCLVTELPLFTLTKRLESQPGIPLTHMKFRAMLPELRARLMRGGSAAEEMEQFGVVPLDLATAIWLQLRVIEAGLLTAAGGEV